VSVLLSDDILQTESERHKQMLEKFRLFNRKLSLKKLLKREAPLTTVGRFMQMADSKAIPHDAEKVRKELGY
jgi:hypothetical protein